MKSPTNKLITVRIREIIRSLFILVRYQVLKKVYRMDIDKSALISFGARLDKTNPMGIHIGKGTYIASGALIMSHDYCRALRVETYIGECCFIGANTIIMPGIKIGNNVIIGSGAVVTKDVTNNCIVVGNPANKIKENIQTKLYGQIIIENIEE
jgi:acetyltransferase-like isoleucine patch superfamily enzyme